MIHLQSKTFAIHCTRFPLNSRCTTFESIASHWRHSATRHVRHKWSAPSSATLNIYDGCNVNRPTAAPSRASCPVWKHSHAMTPNPILELSIEPNPLYVKQSNLVTGGACTFGSGASKGAWLNSIPLGSGSVWSWVQELRIEFQFLYSPI